MSNRQRVVLRKGARSENGRNLYKHLAGDVQGSPIVEELALIVAALMNYQRFFPDLLNDSRQSIKSSYLADIQAIFCGNSVRNSRRVVEKMVFAFRKKPHSFGDQFEDLLVWLYLTDSVLWYMSVTDSLMKIIAARVQGPVSWNLNRRVVVYRDARAKTR